MPARRRALLLGGGVLLAVVLGYAALFLDRHLDRSFITYRYAQNIAHGLGFAYNPGEPVLSQAVAPLYAFLLALGARFTGNLPLLSNLIGVVAIGLGGAALFGLAQRAGIRTAVAAAAFYLAFPLLWVTLGLEVALWMALGLFAIWLHEAERGPFAALLLGLALLMRPEIAVLVCILVADSLRAGRPLRLLPAGVFVGVVSIGLLWSVTTLEGGGLLPGLAGGLPISAPPDALAADPLAGLAALGAAAFHLSAAWLVVLLFAVAGTLALAEQRWVWPPLGWAVLHLVSLLLPGAPVYAWSFAPLLPALALLGALGVDLLLKRFKTGQVQWAVGGFVALVLVIAAVQSAARLALVPPAESSPWAALSPPLVESRAQEADRWLRDHTPAQATVGTTHLGALGYQSGRRMLDYYGSLQPDLAQAYERGDGSWWLSRYAPDYVVLRAGEYDSLDGYTPAADPWFAAHYAEAARFAGEAPGEEPLLIFARTEPPLPLEETLIGLVRYPNGLAINGISTDFSLDPLDAGRPGRVELEWWLEEGSLPEPQHVSIRIQSRQGTLAALEGRVVDFSRWPQRRLITTYHQIELAPAPPPGIYDVAVGIGPDPLNLTWQTIAQAKVPIPEAVYLGAVSGARAEFGDVALNGYRLVSQEEGLEVLLMWEAINPPQADYRVAIQVRDPLGAIVARLEAEPLEGAYPSSFWARGEQVPDTYVLSTAGIPPGNYDVYVGLIDPDDRRLLTVDGRDAVFVGRVSVGGG
jgi:hypothetical protein